MEGRLPGSPSGGYGSFTGRDFDSGTDFISFGSNPLEGYSGRGHSLRGRDRWHNSRGGRGGNNRNTSGGMNSPSPYGQSHCNQKWRNSKNRDNQRGSRNSGFGSSGDISTYYHPSMMEDPWRDLEHLLNPTLANEKHNTISKTGNLKNADSSDYVASVSVTSETETSYIQNLQNSDTHSSGSDGSTSS